MRNAFVTAGAALVLGGLGFTGPAQAVSPLSRSRRHSPAHSRRKTSRIRKSSTICIPTSRRCRLRSGPKKAAPEGPAVERPKGEAKDGDNVEQEEFKEDGIGAK